MFDIGMYIFGGAHHQKQNHGSVECLAGKDWRNLEMGSSYFPRMESMFKFSTSKVRKILVKLETLSKCED